MSTSPATPTVQSCSGSASLPTPARSNVSGSKSYLSTEVKWALVDQVFDNRWECWHCPHLERVAAREDEPGGVQCTLIFNSALFGFPPIPELCPGYEDKLAKFERELQFVVEEGNQ